MQISQIIDKINDSQLFVPAFQREYVWKRPAAKALFSSLIKNYPTGTILTWETTCPPELKGTVKYVNDMGAVKLILDGQQRITTIYMILEGKLPPYYTPNEILQDISGLYINLQTLELEYYKKQAMANNPLWQNLTDIFQSKVRSSDVRRILRDKGELTNSLEDTIDDNFEAVRSIRERDFPEQIIPVTASIKEAIDIFYIVNASGVNLTEAELALAQISGYWPQARELFKRKLFELGKNGFVFKLDFLIYALLGVVHGMGSDMRKLHSAENKEDIMAAWEKLDSQTLDYVMNILQSHAFVDHTAEINSSFALIPLIVYAFDKENGQLSEVEIKKAVKWFYYSQLRQRYVSQTPQKLDKDISIVRQSDSPFEELLGMIEQERPLKISSDEFVGRDIRHPLFSLMRWYFKSKQAVCLGSGVSIRRNMGKKYDLEKDHIFPYAALKKAGYNLQNRFKYALAQEITNRAILSQVENRSKSDTAAIDYLTSANMKFPTALEKQCIPNEPELWSMDNFENFLATRRELLTGELNNFLENITSLETVATLSIEDIISQDEHTELEFKSSLRWDLDEEKVNKKLETVILKTIAAFNNSYGEGGTLVIGYSEEDEQVCGLENDYATLQKQDRDGFELHLKNLIVREFGHEYAASFGEIRFHEVDSKDVCVVEVKKGSKPLFVTVQDKNGVRSEKFFYRSGNQSPPIVKTSEITSYISDRFKN